MGLSPEEEEAHRREVEKIADWIKISCLMILAILAIGIGLIYLKFVLVPLVLARFFVYLFQPFINYLVGKKNFLPGVQRARIHMPRPLAVLICFIAALGIVFLLGFVVYLSLADMLDDYQAYVERFEELADNFKQLLMKEGLTEAQVESIYPSLSAHELISEVLSGVSELLTQSILFFMFLIYMLLEYDERRQKDDLELSIDSKIRAYIVLKIAISMVVGFLVGVVLLILQVDMAVLFGLLSFLLNFIPSVGCIIATFLPLPIVLLDPNQTWWSILLVLFVPGGIHFGIGNFVEPNVMGKSMHMSAVSVLASLAFWGGVWGLVGAFISVPLTVILHVWLVSVDHPLCQFLGYSLAGDFHTVPKGDKEH